MSSRKQRTRYPRTKTGRYSLLADERACELKQKNPKAFGRLPKELRDSVEEYERAAESIGLQTIEATKAWEGMARRLPQALRLIKPLSVDLWELIRQNSDELGKISIPQLLWLQKHLPGVIKKALKRKPGRSSDEDRLSRSAVLLNQGDKSSEEIGAELFPQSNDPGSEFRSWKSKNRAKVEKEQRRQRGEFI